MFDLSWIEWLNKFLETPSAARAIVLGLLVSWGGTQIIKFSPLVQKFPTDVARTATQVIAFLLAFVPTFLLWPPEGEAAMKFVMSVVVATWAPKAYTKASTFLYHFFPFLEPKLSATPVPKEDAQTPPQ